MKGGHTSAAFVCAVARSPPNLLSPTCSSLAPAPAPAPADHPWLEPAASSPSSSHFGPVHRVAAVVVESSAVSVAAVVVEEELVGVRRDRVAADRFSLTLGIGDVDKFGGRC